MPGGGLPGTRKIHQAGVYLNESSHKNNTLKFSHQHQIPVHLFNITFQFWHAYDLYN
jgi:hypothetical protein